MQEIISQLPAPFNLIPAWALLLLVTWMVVWKGLALWKSARLNQPVWFIFLLVINTMGILEILYIYVFSKFAYDHLTLRKPKK
jgi:uncharacterized protein (DUF983 family)